MFIDTTPVSKWLVLSKGFKTYEVCPRCQSDSVVYFKVRSPGYAGFLSRCDSCSKELPIRMKAVSSAHDKSPRQSDFAINH